MLGNCDLLVSHGGNLAAGSCARGVPQLVLPRNYEQYLTARRIEQLGCGAWLPANAAPAAVGTALERTLGDPRIAFASRAFAQRYPAFSPTDQRRLMALRIEQILGAQPILSRSPTSRGPEK